MTGEDIKFLDYSADELCRTNMICPQDIAEVCDETVVANDVANDVAGDDVTDDDVTDNDVADDETTFDG